MKKIISIVVVAFFVYGCQRTSGQTWENMKTANSYLHRLGNSGESRMVKDKDGFIGPADGDFIALNDRDLKNQFTLADRPVPQPRFAPGEKGCPISGIDDFKKPQGELAQLLQDLHFDTDDHVLRSKEDLAAIIKIADYMKKNPSIYLSIEGHCDERASAAYNMALGARRANHVRVLLIKNGIDFNRIYAISQGKEKPLALGHSSEDWKINRRAEFKVYAK
jgi:peptidoglycan-associated lipoprotein